MPDTVRITGLDELNRMLGELPGKIQKNILRSALRQGLKVFARGARQRVPVKSGRLRNSIRVSVRLRNGVPVGTVTAGGGKGDKAVPYAHLVEFPTKAHAIEAAAGHALAFGGIDRHAVSHPGTPGEPFMRPTLDGDSAAATLAFAQQVAARLTKEGLEAPDLALEQGQV